MKRVVAIGLLALLPSLASAEDLFGERHAKLVATMSKKACVPPARLGTMKNDETANRYSLFVGGDGSNVVACAARAGDFGIGDKPFQCWTVDPKTGALATREVMFVPGHAYGVSSGCAEGYCKPGEKPPTTTDHREVLAFSLDGSKVARTSGPDILIFDTKTKKFERQFPMLDDQGNGNGLGTGDIIYVGDMLVVVGYAAGPDGGAFLWNASKGTFLGPIGKPANPGSDSVPYVNLYNGTYELVDATHLVVRDAGYEEATVDLTTGAISARSLPTPKGCTAAEVAEQQNIDIVGEGDKPSARCRKALAAAQKKFWPAPPISRGMITIGATGYKLVHGVKAELLVLPAGAKKPRSVTLPVCKVRDLT